MRVRFGAAMVLALVGCRGAPGNDPSTKVTVKTAAIIGSDAHNANTDPNQPAVTTGWLMSAVGFCTGIPIKRDVILAAGHCFCSQPNAPLDSVTFHLPTFAADGTMTDHAYKSKGFLFQS